MNLEEPVYKAATRRAVKWGVPMQPLMLVIAVAFLLGVWGTLFIHIASIIFGWKPGLWPLGWLLGVFVAAFGLIRWMRSITRNDDQRLEQLLRVRALNKRHRRSRALWRCRSYSPIPCKGAPDAWHP
jgi:type IV secretion system protein VirB3